MKKLNNVLSSGNEVVRRIRKIILHEDYDKKSFRSDIALLFLDSPVDLSQQVKPICIEEDALISKASEQCVVTGWGRTRNELGPTSDILQELQVWCSLVDKIIKSDKSKGYHLN